MASRSLAIFLTAVAAATTLAGAFAPDAARHTAARRGAVAPLSMGLFDSFTKAFSNEEYGAPPDAIKAAARHILVPSKEEAEAVLGEIGKGETSFAALAGQYSTCPSKSSGGSLGSFSPGTMVKEFDEVVFSPKTKIGEVMGPIQTQFGYHLLVVDKRTGGSDWY
ncbi:hypothetical protein ACHAWF_005371 [Thalassiosira exigua]